MSIFQLVSVLGNLALGLLSAPAPPAGAADNPAFSAATLKPIPAHAATMMVADEPAEAVTKETCAACHEDQVASFDRSEHNFAMAGSGAECTACHGDANAHLEAGGGAETMVNPKKDLTAESANTLCLTCHEKAGEQAHAGSSEHVAAGVSCVSCHNVHPSAETKAAHGSVGKSSMVPTSSETCMNCHRQVQSEFSMPVHHRLKEGVLECSTCHNMHGSEFPKQLRAEPKDLCTNCHQDKRGPFMFEHEAGNEEGCVACHAPHGSAGENMLKVRDTKSLCITCHSRETGVGPHPRMSTSTTVDCTKCHTRIHGSNHNPFLTQ